jgi:hypothetical protein
MRFFRGQKHHSAAGLYAKLPVATTGLEHSDGNHGDWGDWD